MTGKEKTEIRMYAWYMITEPFRFIKRLFNRAGKSVNRDTATYMVALFTLTILFSDLIKYREIRNISFWAGFVILVVMHFKNVWDKKKFIHVYRETKYK